jgi:hypothetical protein
VEGEVRMNCVEHAKGKPCVKVIAEGKCLKEKCQQFPKILKILPKLKKLHELEAQGVILSTLWDFSEEGIKTIEKRKKKAEEWLKHFYPKIRQNLQDIIEV